MTQAPPVTLAEFLRARLDEDHEVAFGGAPSPWREGAWDGDFEGAREVLDRHGDVTAVAYYGGTYGHVLRFDPTRVLAEVEAKRRIVEALREIAADDWFDPPGPIFSPGDETEQAAFVLQMLALPYAGHPSYRSEWAP